MFLEERSNEGTFGEIFLYIVVDSDSFIFFVCLFYIGYDFECLVFIAIIHPSSQPLSSSVKLHLEDLKV